MKQFGMGTNGLRMLLAGAVFAAWSFGCARLEPMIEPEVSDLQVTVDSLRSAVRDAQRTVSDLRIELEDRRKELADAQVGRAQLQGMLREAERRLLDARHIIDLQREELASARVEREHVAQSGRRLHSRMRQLENLLPHDRKQVAPTGEMAPAAYAPHESPQITTIPMSVPQSVPSNASGTAMSADTFMPKELSAAEYNTSAHVGNQRTVIVREGETLWRLARRHKVDLEELKRINGMTDNRIVTGSTLRLPETRSSLRFRASSTAEVRP
ncbi:MAG: LysM peptidoglycan-binding domain-containing protein [Nitrospiraceae bacterium]